MVGALGTNPAGRPGHVCVWPKFIFLAFLRLHAVDPLDIPDPEDFLACMVPALPTFPLEEVRSPEGVVGGCAAGPVYCTLAGAKGATQSCENTVWTTP